MRRRLDHGGLPIEFTVPVDDERFVDDGFSVTVTFLDGAANRVTSTNRSPATSHSRSRRRLLAW
ncbi:MAG: hypothetical protein R2715_22120 [Ilumatobacteraceae bacterium]